jgi:hypothetical protein
MRKSHDLAVSRAMNASRTVGPWLLVLGMCLTAVLPSCGKSSSSTPTPVTTPPTTVPTFAGSYSGTMLYNVAGLAELRLSGRTTVTQNGNTIDFSNMVLTSGATSITILLGSAVLNGNAFTGTADYNSSGCGAAHVVTSGRFAGNLMNLTATLTFANANVQGCARSETRGELSR